MKKLIMMAVAAMMATTSIHAQSAGEMYIKPMVGATMSKIAGKDVEGSKFRFGFTGGAEFGYQIADPFALTAGVVVAMQGSNYKDDQFVKDKKAKTTYLNVPILANFYVVRGLAIKAGIQPGFLLSAKDSGSEYLISAKDSGSEYYENAWHSYEDTSKDGLNKFDLSIPVGLSYEFSDFVIDARYNIGLTKVMKDTDLIKAPSARNSVFMLTLGYKIHL